MSHKPQLKSSFEIFCRDCHRLIYEDGVEIDAEAIFFMQEWVLSIRENAPVHTDILGICEHCKTKGVTRHPLVNSIAKQVLPDEIPVYEVMLS